ncbi:MAG: hypothetical protein R3A52_07735 [Polyangiales bacterium]
MPAGWTAVGLAGAGVGVGIAGLLHAQARRSTYDNDAAVYPAGDGRDLLRGIIDGVDAGRAMTIAGFVLGRGARGAGDGVVGHGAVSTRERAARVDVCAPAMGGGAGV